MTYEAFFKDDVFVGCWVPVADYRIIGDPAEGIAKGLLRLNQNPSTLALINSAILSDKSLSPDAMTALIDLMRVAYEEAIS